MAIRALNKLTARQVETLVDGVHSDGGNLLLYVHSNGAGRSPATSKVREMGLGRAGNGAVLLAAAPTSSERHAQKKVAFFVFRAGILRKLPA